MREAPPWLASTPPSDPIVAAALELMLGRGEAESNSLAAERRCRLIVDDHQARAAAARLGVEVIGTVGILLRATQKAAVSPVRPWLDALETSGFRVDARLRFPALELPEKADRTRDD